MWIHCPSCQKTICEIKAETRANLIVHCPFCGCDFSATVESPETAAAAPVADEGSSPA